MNKIPTWVWLAGGAALLWWLVSRNTASAAPGAQLSPSDIAPVPNTQRILTDLQAAGEAATLTM